MKLVNKGLLVAVAAAALLTAGCASNGHMAGHHPAAQPSSMGKNSYNGTNGSNGQNSNNNQSGSSSSSNDGYY